MANSSKNEPITGPFPDGDSRNVTLAQNRNAFEPERTGPQEPTFRGDDAPTTVMGTLAGSELKSGAEAPTANRSPEWKSMGDGTLGGVVASITAGAPGESVSHALQKRMERGNDRADEDRANEAATPASTTVDAPGAASQSASQAARTEPYTLQKPREPGAAETAFGGVGGVLSEPLLQEDWNPAERNSDDLSR